MKKYDPDESITCPKCGRAYKAEVMSVKYYSINPECDSFMRLTSLCGWYTQRYPLDYKEPT